MGREGRATDGGDGFFFEVGGEVDRYSEHPLYYITCCLEALGVYDARAILVAEES